jgi:hypothetical protein
VPTQWRHYHLFAGEHALVLACDGDAAHEVHERAAAAAATIEHCTGSVPARGLLIALSAADPLPIADPAAYGDAVRRWHASRSPSEPSFSLQQRSGQSVDVDPALVMHLVATGVPKDDETLALPGPLRDAASFVAIVPTDSCLEATCSTLFDAAAAAEGVSSWQIALVSLVAGHPATIMSEHAGKAVDVVLYDAWLAALGVDDTTAAAVRTRAGLPTGAGDGETPALAAGDFEQAQQEFRKSLVRPHDASPFFLSPLAHHAGLYVVPEHVWDVVIDLCPVDDPFLPQVVARAGLGYEQLRMATVVATRADAERLAAIHRRHGDAKLLLVTNYPQQAASLLAMHAFFVGGADKAQALAVARHYGAADHLSMIEQKLASEARSR